MALKVENNGIKINEIALYIAAIYLNDGSKTFF